MIKKLSFPKIKMQSEPIFLSGSLAVFKFRISVPSFAKGFGRASGIFGQTPAAAGGEMCPNYFKNSPRVRRRRVAETRVRPVVSRVEPFSLGPLAHQNYRDIAESGVLPILPPLCGVTKSRIRDSVPNKRFGPHWEILAVKPTNVL